MKKYLLFLSLGAITITPHSFTMMNNLKRIAITKKSEQKLKKINKDHTTISNLISLKSKNLSLYKTPSELLNNLRQDKSINTEEMSLDTVFYADHIQWLDQQLKRISTQNNPDYAWSHITNLLYKQLDNTYEYLNDREIMHSGALVSLKEEGKLPTVINKTPIFHINDCFGEYEDTVFIDIEHWSKEDQEKMFEEIANYKQNLLKE